MQHPFEQHLLLVYSPRVRLSPFLSKWATRKPNITGLLEKKRSRHLLCRVCYDVIVSWLSMFSNEEAGKGGAATKVRRASNIYIEKERDLKEYLHSLHHHFRYSLMFSFSHIHIELNGFQLVPVCMLVSSSS